MIYLLNKYKALLHQLTIEVPKQRFYVLLGPKSSRNCCKHPIKIYPYQILPKLDITHWERTSSIEQLIGVQIREE